MNIECLEWDEFNKEHIEKHVVTPQEVEDVCHSDFWAAETYNNRLRLIGLTTEDRVITVILAPKHPKGVYYPVTARPASRRERSEYILLKGGDVA